MTALAVARAHGLLPLVSAPGVRIAALCLMALLVVGAAFQSYRAIDDELTQGVMSRRVALAEVSAAALAGRFQQLTDVAVALATRERFRLLVTEGRWTEAVRIMRDVPHDLPLVDRVFLVSWEGAIEAAVPAGLAPRGLSLTHHEWYQALRRGAPSYVSPATVETDAGRDTVFLVATTIRAPDGGAAGILLLGVRMDDFLRWAKALKLGAMGSIALTDSKNRIVFHSLDQARADVIDFASTPIAARLSAGEQGVAIVSDPVRRERVLSAYTPVGAYGWGVVVDEPVSIAFEARDRQLRRLMTAFALALVLLAAVIWLGSALVGTRRKAERDRQMKAELEQLVAERTAALEATNKELESFSYSVSHDLRSPLRAITGFTRMLEEDQAEKLDGEGRRMLGIIRDNGARMGRLIEDLLAFSRLGRKPLVCADIDMRALVAQAIADVKQDAAYARREVTVEDMPPAWCDHRLVQQVWCNLISNALKYSARNANARVVVSGSIDGDWVTYHVRDNGAGFDMRYYDKLFGVFQRLHSEEEFTGTGVGLAIVQRVVTRHGGRVWAEGRPGEGADFYFTLLRAAPTPVGDPAREARSPS